MVVTAIKQYARLTVVLVIGVVCFAETRAQAQTGRADYKQQTRTTAYKQAQKLVKSSDKLYNKGRLVDAIENQRRAGELFAASVGTDSVEVANVLWMQGELWLNIKTSSGERNYERAAPFFEKAWTTFERLRSTVSLSRDAEGDATRALRNWIRCLREQEERVPASLLARLLDIDLRVENSEEKRRYIVKRALKDFLWSSDFVGAREFLALLEPRVKDLELLAREAIAELASVIDPSEQPGYQVKVDRDRSLGREDAQKHRDALFPEAARALARSDYSAATHLLELAQATKGLVDGPPGEYLIGDAPVLPDELRILLSAAILFDLRDSPEKAEPYLIRARKLLKRTVGLQAAQWPEVNDVASLLGGRADQLWRHGNEGGAQLRAVVAARLTATRLRLDLSALDDAEQLALLQHEVPRQTSRLLSMCSAAECRTEAYSLMINWKGLLIQQLRQEAAFKGDSPPAGRAAELTQLEQSRQALVGLLHVPPSSLSPPELDAAKQAAINAKSTAEQTLRRQARLSAGEAVREILTSGLGERASTLVGLAVDPMRDIGSAGDVDGFASMLGKDEVFLDAYRYDRVTRDGAIEAHYGVFILAASKPLQFVDVGPAARVETAMAEWREAVLAQQPTDRQWKTIQSYVWDPINAEAVTAGGFSKIWFSPDSELARIPIHLFCESSCDKSIAQVDSPREFARLRRVRPIDTLERGVLIAGDIEYGSQESATGRPPLFRSLEWTGREVDELKRIANDSNIDVVEFRRYELTKRALLRYSEGATYVHLATHGFFESSQRIAAPEAFSAGRNVQPIETVQLSTYAHPLLLSGIALSGANTSDPVSYAAPGLLTAEEIVGLDLSRADLVTLSACETGRGAEVTGQGVMGLRGALMSTGARSALLSLWSVGDDSTVEFMKRFYTHLWRNGHSKAMALKLAQQSMKQDPKWSAPIHWAAWILTGEAW